MHRIYSNARNVIIWLGASTEDIDSLFYWMRCLDEQMVKVKYQHTMTTWRNQWKALRDQPGAGERKGLQSLLGREWFSRIWVIQEAALAKAAMITCGRNDVNSRTFVMMPTLLGIICNEEVQSRLEIMPGLLRKNSWWAGPDFQDLGVLLQKFSRSKAKDPRDVIYALLGLSKDASTSNTLRPNYEISLQEAIQHTVAYLLNQSGHVKQYPDHKDMPAWNLDRFLSTLKELPLHVYDWTLYPGESFSANSSILWKNVEKVKSLNRTYSNTSRISIGKEDMYRGRLRPAKRRKYGK